MGRPGLRQRAVLIAAAMAIMAFAAACSGTDSGSGDAVGSGSVPDEPVQAATGPVRVSEQVEATTQDGVLFDLKLTLPVFDQNGSGSRRDDAEVVAPDKTEYQGIFSDGPGTLLIVSCFADVCQTDEKKATFEVHYWIESAPDALPAGISLIGG